MLIEYQNKIGLAILAFWLENDGSLPLTLYEKHRDFIKNDSYRQQYMHNNRDNNFFFKFLIRHLRSSYTKIIEELGHLTRVEDMSNEHITVKTVGLSAELHIADRLVDLYKGLQAQKDKAKFRSEVLKLIRIAPMESQESGTVNDSGSPLKLINGLKMVYKSLGRQDPEWDRLLLYVEKTDFQERYLKKVQVRVFLLQLMSTIDAFEAHNGRDKDRLAILERWR